MKKEHGNLYWHFSMVLYASGATMSSDCEEVTFAVECHDFNEMYRRATELYDMARTIGRPGDITRFCLRDDGSAIPSGFDDSSRYEVYASWYVSREHVDDFFSAGPSGCMKFARRNTF